MTKSNIRLSYNWDPTTEGPSSVDSQTFTIKIGNLRPAKITKITGSATITTPVLIPSVSIDATKEAIAYWAAPGSVPAEYSGSKTVTNYTGRLFVTPVNNNDVNALLDTQQEITVVFYPWKSALLSNLVFYLNLEAQTSLTLEIMISVEYEEATFGNG